MPTVDQILADPTIANTTLLAVAKRYHAVPGAIVTNSITSLEIETIWNELKAKPGLRTSIRDLASIAHPPNDTQRGVRLSQVLQSLTVLGKKPQIALVLGVAGGWKLEDPVQAYVCLANSVCAVEATMRKTLPINGTELCCGEVTKDIGGALWASRLGLWAKGQRTKLGLLSPGAKTIFFAQGTELFAMSR